MSNVCHFIRKPSQIKSSFIFNQIQSHINYKPYVVHRLKSNELGDSGFAEFDKQIRTLDLAKEETVYDKLLYSGPKLVSKKQYNKIESFIEENNIKIAHFHYGSDCGIFYPYSKLLAIPKVVSFYGYDCTSFPKYVLGYGKIYLNNRVFKTATKILAMSPDMKNDLINLGCPEHKIIVHYHGIDCKKFYQKHDYSEKNKFVLLILASLVPKKGHLFLLKSIKQLITDGIHNFELRIVGGGGLENELKQFVQENNLQNYVSFIGIIKYGGQEMLREYKNADIFVHPSIVASDGDKEGIPGTLIEALSAGLPSVSTNHAGIPFVIQSGINGLLVNENDCEALSFVIRELLTNKLLREKIGNAGQEYALKYLDLNEKTKELEQIYTSLI